VRGRRNAVWWLVGGGRWLGVVVMVVARGLVPLGWRSHRRRGGGVPAAGLSLEDQAHGQEGHQESGFATHSHSALTPSLLALLAGSVWF
jgi:hypothetical protein